MREGVAIDGSLGEGGGQILRTSLALSMITQRPLRMRKIRAGRPKPGLRRQHLACVEAAARLCNAFVRGATVGSTSLDFDPGPIATEQLAIDIGSAGSTTLVVQTILVPAVAGGHALRGSFKGGTHNPLAPSFEFLDRAFLPQLRAMGADVALVLEQHGFAPAGGGKLLLEVRPGKLAPIAIDVAGPIASRTAIAITAQLPTHVAERELGVVRERLGVRPEDCEHREVPRGGPANVLIIDVDRTTCREVVTGFGEKGVRAELVASRACDEVDRYLAAGVPVGEHLADQLLLPMAVAGGGRFRTGPLSLHATTNIDTIRAFLDVPIRVEPAGEAFDVIVGERSTST
jgi:RNA 3'-terminal phosphate cyclase (ATP)